MRMSPAIFPVFAKCLAAGAAALQWSCSSPDPKPVKTAEVTEVRTTGKAQHGIASIYTDRRTASGERFRSSALTAAHRSIPLGTKVKVTHLGNSRSVIVRINDRGPYIRGRIIDLTPAAAAQLGFGYKQGLARVKVERF
jgi:rare lipoprotein A